MIPLWIVVLVIAVVPWVASLCKVLYSPYSSYSNHFIVENGDGEIKEKRNVLLVIAHPDDESMFFAPTLLFLTSLKHNVHILCISTGDAEGKGPSRKEELYRACAVFKVPPQNVKILDHPALQDGFNKQWSYSILADIIVQAVTTWKIKIVITFDGYGISGHCNHRDVHRGLCKLLMDHKLQTIEAWELISTNILRKFLGPVDIWYSLLEFRNHKKEEFCCVINQRPGISYQAMEQHASQLVWYRKLFVRFSRYAYINTLRKIKI